jgi:hypothetical protein
MTIDPTTRRTGNPTRLDRGSPEESRRAPVDRAAVRLSAWLLLGGQLLYILVTQLHAGEC